MNEKDKEKYLEDFKKADASKKLDMWYHAIEQEGLWEELLAELSAIAQAQSVRKGTIDDE